MIAEDVKKEMKTEFDQLQSNGLKRLQEADKKYKDELKEMERAHEIEMNNLRGQQLKSQKETMEYEQKRAEKKSEHENKLKKLEMENEKEQSLLQKKNEKLFKESSQLNQKIAKEESNQLQEMLNQGMTSRLNIERREEGKSSGNVILETVNKWNAVKEIHDFVKLTYFITSFNMDEKTDVLEQLKLLMNEKSNLDNHLMKVRGVLGKWKQTISKEQFENVQHNLDQLSTKNIGEMISDLRQTLKMNKNPDRNSLLQMDKTMNNYNTFVDNFLQNQTNLMLTPNSIGY